MRQAHRNRDDAKELMAEEKPTALMAAPEAASLELSAGTAGSWTSEKASSRHLCLLPTTKPQQLFTALLSWAGGGEQPGESHWFQFSQDLRGLFFFSCLLPPSWKETGRQHCPAHKPDTSDDSYASSVVGQLKAIIEPVLKVNINTSAGWSLYWD